ncbi:MAG: MFS transporter [Dethiosulfovibrio peptidovorans]|nr:MAG: MFS transporter [Dethiosulfovibrio peptidovorans]
MTENRRSFVVLLTFTFFMVTGFEMIMPLVIGHYVGDLGFAATAVGGALALRKFSQQGLALLGGILADRNDVKLLVTLGMLMRTVGFAFLAFAQSFPSLLVAMIFIGLGGVAFETPYQAAIAALTTPENRSRYFSMNNTLVGVASTVGPLLGALLLVLDFKAVCFGAAGCFFVNAVISLVWLPSIRPKTNPLSVGRSLKILKRDRRYIRFVALMSIFWLAASQIDITFPLRIRQISGAPESVSWMYSVYAAVTAILQYPLVSRLLRTHTPRQIIVMGTVVISAALAITPFIPTTRVFLCLVAVYTVGMLLARPNQQSMAINLAEKGTTGLYLGFNAMSFAVGSGGGAILGGFLFDMAQIHHTPLLPWAVFCIIGALAVVGFVLSKDLDHERTEGMTPSEN